MKPAPFQIHCRESNGNLHVRPEGNLDCQTAQQLADLILTRYDGKGLVFIETGGLRDDGARSAGIFKLKVESSHAVPAPRLVFKGVMGFDMAPEGSRVLLVPEKKRCSGKGSCKHCSCELSRPFGESPAGCACRNAQSAD